MLSRDMEEANLRENWFPELIFSLNVTHGNPRNKLSKRGIFPFWFFHNKREAHGTRQVLLPQTSPLDCALNQLQKWDSNYLQRLQSLLEEGTEQLMQLIRGSSRH